MDIRTQVGTLAFKRKFLLDERLSGKEKFKCR